MCFESIKVYNIEDNILNLDKLNAHLREVDGEIVHRESLKEHLDLCLKYFYKIIEEKNLNKVILNMEKSFFKNSSDYTKELWKEMIINIIYMHDLGKSNPNFQSKKMKNNIFKTTSSKNSDHSLISSIIYFDTYFDKIIKNKGEDRYLLLFFLLVNSYVISKHHGYLKDFYHFAFSDDSGTLIYEIEKNYKNEYVNYKGNFEESKKYTKYLKNHKVIQNIISSLKKQDNLKCIDMFIYARFIFGLLVSCDFYATSEYQNEKEIKNLGVIKKIKEFEESFNATEVSKAINDYRDFKINKTNKCPFKEDDINLFRSEMFLESEENLVKNIDEHIFFLEAPTGSGKTNSSINLAIKSIKHNAELNKIFYIFPFNTLVEQTKEVLDNVFSEVNNVKQKIAVVNSISSMIDFKEEYFGKEKTDYERTLLARQFLHYPITLSTHVNLFNYLFGLNRESVFPLVQLANSIVIIDEVQSYRNKIWTEIILFLKAYAKILNIKFIIMSATLPNLSVLSFEKHGFCNLILDRKKYYENKLFKERVILDYSLIENGKKTTMEELKNKVLDLSKAPNKNIVVEFIKKSTALEFFNILKNEKLINRDIELITGDDNRAERKRIIDKVKNQKDIILVATQVIEAGVDIDMDYGFKDISILDSEEQLLGRINRSCKNKNQSIVFFFDLDNASGIYKEDVRKIKELTLSNKRYQDILANKNFPKYYEAVLEYIMDRNKEFNENNIENFMEESVLKLNFQHIAEKMKLIDDDRNQYQVFINGYEKDKNGNNLIGEEVWSEYYNLLKDNSLDYSEKKVKLSRIREKMDYFIYNVSKINFSYDNIIGDIVYIDDGEKFFENGKFNPKAVKGFDSFEIIEE